MAIIEFEADGLSVDASVLGQSLGIKPSLVQVCIREGKITSFCERRVDDDAGRYRLTFFYGNRRLRLTVDEGGNVIRRSIIDFGDREFPTSLHKSGT
jgi:hypothetical protein